MVFFTMNNPLKPHTKGSIDNNWRGISYTDFLRCSRSRHNGRDENEHYNWLDSVSVSLFFHLTYFLSFSCSCFALIFKYAGHSS